MSIDEQIEALQAQISVLNEQKLKETRDKILPFLRENARLVWGDYTGRMDVVFKSGDLELEAIRLLEEASGSRGFHHMSVEIAQHTYFSYDDGRITLGIPCHGHVTEMGENVLKQVVEYGIEIDFGRALNNAQREVDLKQMKLNGLKKLKETYESRV